MWSCVEERILPLVQEAWQRAWHSTWQSLTPPRQKRVSSSRHVRAVRLRSSELLKRSNKYKGYLVSGFCPLSHFQKINTEHFRNWVCFLSHADGSSWAFLNPRRCTRTSPETEWSTVIVHLRQSPVELNSKRVFSSFEYLFKMRPLNPVHHIRAGSSWGRVAEH